MRADARNAPRRPTTPAEVQAAINVNAASQERVRSDPALDKWARRAAVSELQEKQTALFAQRALLKART